MFADLFQRPLHRTSGSPRDDFEVLRRFRKSRSVHALVLWDSKDSLKFLIPVEKPDDPIHGGGHPRPGTNAVAQISDVADREIWTWIRRLLGLQQLKIRQDQDERMPDGLTSADFAYMNVQWNPLENRGPWTPSTTPTHQNHAEDNSPGRRADRYLYMKVVRKEKRALLVQFEPSPQSRLYETRHTQRTELAPVVADEPQRAISLGGLLWERCQI